MVAHPNKRKGDQAERDVLRMVLSVLPEASRTRPGRMEDQGDILADEFTIQVKDVASAQWKTWLDEWDAQHERSGRRFKLLVWKRRGRGGKKPRWLAVMELDQLLDVLAERG